MTWLFRDEATPTTAALLGRFEGEAALVPALWFIEVINVLARAERRGRITVDQSNHFLAELQALDIAQETEASTRALTALLPLCRTYSLTAYDAAYLDLACRTGLPLATLDRELRKAAAQLGIELLGL